MLRWPIILTNNMINNNIPLHALITAYPDNAENISTFQTLLTNCLNIFSLRLLRYLHRHHQTISIISGRSIKSCTHFISHTSVKKVTEISESIFLLA